MTLHFARRRILCLGDIMLDRFVYGHAGRISPEAPVPVVKLAETRHMLGGVGNVARNIASLGGTAILIGLIGEDDAGSAVRGLIAGDAGLVDACFGAPGRPTTSKTRVIATHQHLLRLDDEEAAPIDATTQMPILAAIDRHKAGADAIIISDYAKGLLTDTVVRYAMAAGAERGIPVLVDPKRSDIGHYRGANVITPNLRELQLATGMPVASEAEIVAAARRIMAEAGAGAVLVTRSERGMMLVEADGAVHSAPAIAQEVFDVSGAGDTVIAILALAVASGVSLPQAMRMANAGAGVVVGKLGTATLSPAELEVALGGGGSGRKCVPVAEAEGRIAAWRRQGLVVGFTNGCFDILHRGHVTSLAAARERCDRLVVALNADDSVKRVKGPSRPINPLEDRMAVIEALTAVDLVVAFEECTPLETIQALRPAILFKGEDYRGKEVVGSDIVRADGGEVVLLPLVEGRSTTTIIARSRGE